MKKFLMSMLLICFGAVAVCPAADEHLVRCRHAAVVSVSPPATAVGVDVLAHGGTAVDAAVATAFALSVTWPVPATSAAAVT